MGILLHKIIKEGKSYLAIWVVEVLSEVVANSDPALTEPELQACY